MRVAIWQATLKSLTLGMTILWIISGCAHFEKIFQPKPEEAYPVKIKKLPEDNPFVHKVKWPGESLSIIAKWYTGDSKNWKALAKANPDLNPNLIRIGDNIVVPQPLLKNGEPMPREFLSLSPQKADGIETLTNNKKAPEKPKLEREELELLDEVWDVYLESDSQNPSPSEKPEPRQ